VLTLTVTVAVLLYFDRYILGNATNKIKTTLGLDDESVSWLIGAFFFSYAFGQIGAGWLADRFGARRVLSVAIFAWSACTALVGVAVGFWELFAYRFWCGLFESVAYPACAGIIRRWVPASARGMASGVVSLGGRIGGAVTPKITVTLMAISATQWPTVADWRPVFLLFGTLGICLAGVFWFLHRDRPEQNRRVNAAERALIAADEPPPSTVPGGRLLPALLTNRSLWLCSIVQAGSNFGWVFLFQTLQPYLYQVHRTDQATNGTMCSVVGIISVPAVLLGGWLADALTRRLGKRWGRALPLSLPRFVAAGLYGVVAILHIAWLQPTPLHQSLRIAGDVSSTGSLGPGLCWPMECALGNLGTPMASEMQTWTIVLLCGLIAFFSDLTLPAIWAYSMDVGGKHAGLVLGWGNMWGNLGAAISPTLLILAAKSYGWTSAFWICGGVFFTIAVLSLFVDATEIVDA
jgi:sugar phosphate permease